MTIFERFPYWVFVIVGLVLIGGASLQYMATTGTLHRVTTTDLRPSGANHDMVFFGQFDETRDIAPNGEVHLLGQIDPFHVHHVTDARVGEMSLYMFQPAEARPGTDTVSAVVAAPDNQAFLRWMGENVAGNASIGDLFAIKGRVTRDRAYVSPIVNWISQQGMSTPEDFIVILPFTEGALPASEVGKVGLVLPVMIMLLGGFCLILGYRRWELNRIHTQNDPGLGVAILQGVTN